MIIAEKLRQAYHNDLTDCPILLDAADELAQLEQERDALREALKPFAEASRRFDEAATHFGAALRDDDYKPKTEFTHGELRAARAALEAKP